jgi:hypothetical protein
MSEQSFVSLRCFHSVNIDNILCGFVKLMFIVEYELV